jgi:hypothetical protein
MLRLARKDAVIDKEWCSDWQGMIFRFARNKCTDWQGVLIGKKLFLDWQEMLLRLAKHDAQIGKE